MSKVPDLLLDDKKDDGAGVGIPDFTWGASVWRKPRVSGGWYCESWGVCAGGASGFAWRKPRLWRGW